MFVSDPALDVGLMLFRPDGALDFANGRAQALFGCKDLAELEERLDGVRERLTPALMRLEPRSRLLGSVDVETTVEGRPRSLRLELSRVGEKGSEGFLAVVTDEATMRALETDLRLAAHLRALSRVSAAISHDIRTPLHTVVLYLELLRNTLAAPASDSAERRQRYLEVIHSEVQRVEHMLETLLNQTRVQEGVVDRVDLAEMARDLRAFLEPHGKRSRVEIELTTADAPVLVEAERDALRHALLHVLITAVDSCSKQATVRLSVGAADGKAVLALTGAGAGIAQTILDSSREAPPSQRAFGQERGLYVARRVVERHGGSIHVRSGAKRAVTLEIQLPLVGAETG